MVRWRLDGLETRHTVKRLNGQQLNGGGGGKPSPDRDETSPQGSHSTFLDQLDSAVHETIINLLVGGLVHERGTDAVKGRYGAGHEESRQRGGAENGANVLAVPSRGGCDVALGNIVATHLGGVQDAGTEDIGLNSAVETGNALLAVHVAHESEERDGFALVGLCQSFHDIKGVANDTTHTSCDGTSKELEVKGSFLKSRKSANDES